MGQVARNVKLELTPNEAEQTLRSLNQSGMFGSEPYFDQDILLKAAFKLTDAMKEAGVDSERGETAVQD